MTPDTSAGQYQQWPTPSPGEQSRITQMLTALQQRHPAGWFVDYNTGSDPRSNHHVQAIIISPPRHQRALMIIRENIGDPEQPKYTYYWETARWDTDEQDWHGLGWITNENDEYEHDINRVLDQFITELAQTSEKRR